MKAMATNSLRVCLPEDGSQTFGISVARAVQALTPFGEIMRLEALPDARSTFVVSFYDIRAAASAQVTLGASNCQQEPQHGVRSITLSGDVQLSPSLVQEVEAIRQDAGDLYWLDFYDTRAAARAAAQLGISMVSATPRPCVIREAPGLTLQSADDSKSSGPFAPRYRNDLKLSEVNWQDLVSGHETRTTLRLRCLPPHLCEEPAFLRALASAGLDKVVDCYRIFPGQGKRPGSALVNSVTAAGVISLAKYFHGRQWGRSMPVAVSFDALQGAAEVSRAFPDKPLVDGFLKMKASEPWRVETSEVASSTGEPGVSDVSTEAGDDADTPTGNKEAACRQLPALVH